MLKFAEQNNACIPTYVVTPESFHRCLSDFPSFVQTWAEINQFAGNLGQVLIIPEENGITQSVFLGVGGEAERTRCRYALAPAVTKLPSGTYAFANEIPLKKLDFELAGCLMDGYRFDRYKTQKKAGVQIVAPAGVDAARIEAVVHAEALCCDLINTPACDMSPADLESEVRLLAERFDATVNAIIGPELLAQNFPLIHAVGRAASVAPRLIELTHGEVGPKIALVGKGVCFDTGGLNLKPGASMSLMKKDMGGAANILALTQMILSSGLKCKLHVLIPAVENAVSGDAFRPGDGVLLLK